MGKHKNEMAKIHRKKKEKVKAKLRVRMAGSTSTKKSVKKA